VTRDRTTGEPRDIACIEFVEFVTEYLEGTLPTAEVRAFEHHLARCEGCAGYLAQMRETIRLAGSLSPEDVPAAGVEELMEIFRAHRGRPSSGSAPVAGRHRGLDAAS
jgi:anti-sigma factor RsiW